jgi:hypothetical protein
MNITPELLDARSHWESLKYEGAEKLKIAKEGGKKVRIRDNTNLLDKYFNKTSFGICQDSSYLNGRVNGIIKYKKIIPCGKEICHVCGQKDSLLHRQRFARGIYKMISRRTLGYFVFTVPEELRKDFSTKEILKDFTSYVIFLLRNDVVLSVNDKIKVIKGYDKGFVRWHFSGDKTKGYKPHLNVLVGRGAFIEKEELKIYMEYFNARLNEWIQKNLDDKFNKKLIINYSFCSTVNKIINKYKYVVRPTMLNIGPDDLMFYYLKLQNFRNARWWGEWEVFPWSREKLDSKELKLFNNEEIKWEFAGKLADCWNDILSLEYLGFGIFRATG